MAAAFLTCAFVVSSASAKGIYEYVYSGEFIDGNASDKGAFPANLGGVAVDEAANEVLVAVGGEHGYVSKFTPGGAPAQFSGFAPGVDTVSVPNTGLNSEDLGPSPAIALDNTGGANDGNFYVTPKDFFFGYSHGFAPSGNALAGWGVANDAVSGVAVAQSGDILQTSRYDHLQWWTPAGEKYLSINPIVIPEEPLAGIAPIFLGTPGILGTGERLTAPSIDAEGNLYLMQVTAGSGPGTSPHLATKYKKVDSETYVLEYKFGTTGVDISVADTAIDLETNKLFVTEGATVGVFDPATGAKLTSFGAPEGSYEGLTSAKGVAVDADSGVVWVSNSREYGGGTRHVEKFVKSGPITVPTIETGDVDHAETEATLHGTLNPDGVETTDCHFEWGTTWKLGNTEPCVEGNVFAGSSDEDVTAQLTGLTKGQTYWYRMYAKNGNERVADGGPKKFIAQGDPIPSQTFVDRINTDGARFHAKVDPNGGRTKFHFEYGPTTSYGQTTNDARIVEYGSTEEIEKLPQSLLNAQEISQSVAGLTPGQTYHFRVVATNEETTVVGEDREFTTHQADPAVDLCPNAHVRQQVEATLLADCRAYELVSPGYAGGYDVESDVIPGQEPLISPAGAHGKALFSIHDGLVPGVSGNPTNLGRDPYVATRGPDGWTTRYVGLPSNEMAQSGPYGSPLLGNDAALQTFVFGGGTICEPCFGDGSTNVPLRLPDGEIVKGMAGSLNPAADPAGEVRMPLSEDGSTLVFGSEEKFESAGGEGALTIYGRDLTSGVTEVVSTMPNGATMSGPSVAELAVSADGSRVLVGEKLGEDAAGNGLYDLYMHVMGNPASYSLTPGTTTGAIFSGMTSDGASVFFTTVDPLTTASNQDTDTSADMFRAFLSQEGTMTLTRVSTGSGGTGDTDACAPNGDWNVPAGGPDCSVAGIAGGGGVAMSDGTAYFLSPEELDGANGEAGEPNLYVARPGEAPEFVAVLEPSNSTVEHAVESASVRRLQDFQVTPNGRYAVFSSMTPQTGYPTAAHSEIYRYDAPTKTTDCVSCPVTKSPATADSYLSKYGINVIDDGRTFFTTNESLVLRDTNERADAYQWSGSGIQLISTGASPQDSALLTASADGTDVFFFTVDVLSHQDENGNTMKIYTAHELGGYEYDPPLPPCAASDECHGPGTQASAPVQINTVTGAGARAGNGRCQSLGRRATKNSKRAKALRRKAKKAHGKRAKALRRKAKRSAKQAQKLSKRAKSCRRSSGGNG